MKHFFKILLTILCIAGGGTISLQAQLVKLNVKTPGSLQLSLAKIGTIQPGSSLKISGVLNNDDVRALRRLCGSDTLLNSTTSPIRSIDISNVSFVPQGPPYAKNKYAISSRHALPPCFLYGTTIEEIILPDRLDTIREWALSSMPVRKLSIPDNVEVCPKALAYDSLLQDLRLPFTPYLYNFSSEKLKSLRKVEVNGFYTSNYSPFYELPEVEEVIFNGPMGHINATPFVRNPKLKKIIINGPLFSTGTALAAACNALESIQFNAAVGYWNFAPANECENLCRSYTLNAPVFRSDVEEVTPSDSAYLAQWPGRESFLRNGAELAHKTALYVDNDSKLGWLPLKLARVLYSISTPDECQRFIPDIDSLIANALKLDVNKSKLQILQETAPYTTVSDPVEWTYQAPTDSALAHYRQLYNLDQVAGQGTQADKVRNLTYWIHERIRHNGSRPDMPKVPHDLDKLIAYGMEKDSLGGNCRIMAIALTQALLAEGIPARYLTCESKQYDTDYDCHVICMAWLSDQGKWMWADPTFAAFVYDEQGTPLHPGEVRQRLIEGKPLAINPDANWNHQSPQTKEDYLDRYMAKNLYIISAHAHSSVRNEGRKSINRNDYTTIIPEGFEYRRTNRTITNPDIFWAAPSPTATCPSISK